MAKGRGLEYSFEFQGEQLQYSITENIDYQNQAIDLCMRYQLRDTQELEPGVYHIDIFEGNYNIGHTTFVLK